MTDYWYDNRDQLRPEMAFLTTTKDVVLLDRRVAGDGTKWYVLSLGKRGWENWDDTIEPGDLEYRLF